MAVKPEIRKDPKKDAKLADARPKMQFAFTGRNYLILVAGIVLLIIGYITLSGGGTTDPNQFSYELFSARRMVLAPIILMLGYGTVAYGILWKQKSADAEGEPK